MSKPTEEQLVMATAGYWYALGRVQERHHGSVESLLSFEIAQDFSRRMRDSGNWVTDVGREWQHYADELQSLVVVNLGEPEDADYGIMRPPDENDPELERLLAEEEEIERRTRGC